MVTRPNWLDLERKASRREGNQLELAGVGRLVKIADLSAPGSLKSSRHCLFPIINTFSLSLCLSFFLSLSLSLSLSLFLSFSLSSSLASLLSILWASLTHSKRLQLIKRGTFLTSQYEKQYVNVITFSSDSVLTHTLARYVSHFLASLHSQHIRYIFLFLSMKFDIILLKLKFRNVYLF